MEAIALVVIVAIAAVIIVVKNKNQSTDSRVAAASSAVLAAPAAQSTPAIQAGIEEETVAAIMAAISCMTGSESGKAYAVRSISRAKGERPAWCFAGMQQNTRPF